MGSPSKASGIPHGLQVEPKSPPKLVQSLPRAQPGHPECLVPHAGSGLLVTWRWDAMGSAV
jgi:hypothetical protein